MQAHMHINNIPCLISHLIQTSDLLLLPHQVRNLHGMNTSLHQHFFSDSPDVHIPERATTSYHFVRVPLSRISLQTNIAFNLLFFHLIHLNRFINLQRLINIAADTFIKCQSLLPFLGCQIGACNIVTPVKQKKCSL